MKRKYFVISCICAQKQYVDFEHTRISGVAVNGANCATDRALLDADARSAIISLRGTSPRSAPSAGARGQARGPVPDALRRPARRAAEPLAWPGGAPVHCGEGFRSGWSVSCSSDACHFITSLEEASSYDATSTTCSNPIATRRNSRSNTLASTTRNSKRHTYNLRARKINTG